MRRLTARQAPRRLLLSAVGVVAVAGALALFAVLRDPGTSQALMPLPIQPFGPEQQGGISTTQLGLSFTDHTIIEISRGERPATSWVYSAPGFQVARDADIPDETVVGTVMAEVDALCDGGLDTMAQKSPPAPPPPPFTPYDWKEKTTAVAGTPDEFLLTIMPPLPFLLRHETIIDNIYVIGMLANPMYNVLNTVYTSVPWSPPGWPNGTAFIATTKLGGNPVYANEKGRTCLDSPQTSTSITSVYTNPALLGDGGDGIDDATGLYPRWTAFQSDPDDRKPFQSPPSLPSDTNYIERILDLDCYWIDVDGCYTDAGNTITCDSTAGGGNNDTIIQPSESWEDYDLKVTLGGIGVIDNDGDCLQNAATAQPGRPTDTLDTPTGTLCDALPYSGEPNVIRYDTAKDQDCDGLPDGVEAAWGSNPLLADTDNDGATDFVEMYQFTNPNVQDTDGDGLLDRPEDDYIAAPAGGAEAGEAVNADDNCPAVANADQANNDGKHRLAGQEITASPWASNPNQDKMGDLCDGDDDNDLAYDVAEAVDGCALPAVDDDMDGVANDGCPGGPAAAGGPEHGPTDPMDNDTDGDHCVDGVEGYIGADPASSAAPKCPGALNLTMLKFFRACRWNEPPNGYDSNLWNEEQDGVEDNIEWDPDADGLDCITGASITDPDNDDGPPAVVGQPALAQITDNTEIMGFNLQAANKDTDGDGCEDWIEIVDINGNRKADMLDVMFVARKWFILLGGELDVQTGYTPPGDACTNAVDDDGDTVVNDGCGAIHRVTTHAANDLLDIDRNGSVGQSDAMIAAKNSSLVKPPATCDLSPQPGPPDFGVRIDADATNGDGPCDLINDQVDVGGTYQVAICVENPPVAIGAFEVDVVYDDTLSTAPEISCSSGICLDDNPDANVGTTKWGDGLGTGWDCNVMDLAEPTGDADSGTGAGKGRARIASRFFARRCWRK